MLEQNNVSAPQDGMKSQTQMVGYHNSYFYLSKQFRTLVTDHNSKGQVTVAQSRQEVASTSLLLPKEQQPSSQIKPS